MKIDTVTAKYDIHNVSYDPEQGSFTRWPVSIANADEKRWVCISLHKWCVPDGSNRGYYIALLKLYPDGEKLTRAKADEHVDMIRKLHSEYGDELIRGIETSSVDCPGFELLYYRWCINVWRPVTKPKTRWLYVGTKPDKDTCTIERPLQT